MLILLVNDKNTITTIIPKMKLKVIYEFSFSEFRRLPAKSNEPTVKTA